MRKVTALFLTLFLPVLLSACGNSSPGTDGRTDSMIQADAKPASTDLENTKVEEEKMAVNSDKDNLSGTVPDELEYIPSEYQYPAEQAGTLEKLTYQTWESFSYEEHTGTDKRGMGLSALWVF